MLSVVLFGVVGVVWRVVEWCGWYGVVWYVVI